MGRTSIPRPTNLAKLLKDIALDPDRPVKIFCIAFDKGSDLATVEAIAKATDGKNLNAQNPQLIDGAFGKLLTRVQTLIDQLGRMPSWLRPQLSRALRQRLDVDPQRVEQTGVPLNVDIIRHCSVNPVGARIQTPAAQRLQDERLLHCRHATT
jgi:hypothetical protein